MADSAWGAYFLKMKYSININQLSNYAGGFNLDLVDLALFDFIKDFIMSGKCEGIILDGKWFFWINTNYVIEEMPILGITTTRGINLRLENLINANLLLRGPENQSLKRTYLAFGWRAADYMFTTWKIDSKSIGTEIPSINNTNDYIDNKGQMEKCSSDGTLFGEAVAETRPIKSLAISELHPKKEGANRAAATLAERESAFKDECHRFVEEFGERLVDEFVLYWTEPTKGKTRMRFEQQPTWDTHRRMLTWKRNNFNKYEQNVNVGAPKEISAAEIESLMNWRRND